MVAKPTEALLSRAEELSASGELEAARKILLELCNEYPQDAMATYKCAMVHDNLGLELEAVPLYEKAIN